MTNLSWKRKHCLSDSKIAMKTTNNTKQFDCIQVKNEVQAQVLAETSGMSTPELLEYFNHNKTNVEQVG
ncbi:hypothetical protein RsTz2092_13090 [Deferribacterales bacterium RsTz2092]|nr:hypothetical protein AGMMS49941_12260 [Deferribacterales bacterium]